LQLVGNIHLLPFDHFYSPRLPAAATGQTVPALLIYGSLQDERFPELDRLCRRLADENHIVYVLRWRIEGVVEPLWLSGYGVELWLKSTEYKVTDDQRLPTDRRPIDDEDDVENDEDKLHGFNFPRLIKRYPERRKQLEQFREHLRTTVYPPGQSASLAHLSPDELLGKYHLFSTKILLPNIIAISDRAVSYIKQSPLPLQTLSRLAQDFPVYAQALANQTIDRKLISDIRGNQRQGLPAGRDLLWLNGLAIGVSALDVYGLINAIRLESEAVGLLSSRLGISISKAVDIISETEGVSDSNEGPSSSSADGLFDLREPWELTTENSKSGGSDDDSSNNEDDSSDKGKLRAVVWLNDLERDKRYGRWSRSLKHLLIPTGSLPQLRRNLFNCVFIVDLTQPLSLSVLAESIEMIQRNIPLRFGFMPLLLNEDGDLFGKQMAAALYTLIITFNRRVAGEFIQEVCLALS
jgi:UDP-glucose:glycoprotein glucosyltransferase